MGPAGAMYLSASPGNSGRRSNTRDVYTPPVTASPLASASSAVASRHAITSG